MYYKLVFQLPDVRKLFLIVSPALFLSFSMYFLGGLLSICISSLFLFNVHTN
ncbi:hypothetical protein [Sporosarcina pasteurii]|uniref:Uncharacterized protein n=1 Tax=Sporosarcina pasteurii TaxID=1474 RepID=A0A380BFW0_SPOPA|nr:hypothetical protein [Sporosarcina pasteurii]MDS9470377.1 hypothetical protein [Sporosarcina pasteurii]SUI99922.1 Uncharacterised protein [Sporosarcina pasteurii]